MQPGGSEADMTEQDLKSLTQPGVPERLLEAAVALFTRKGYHATSVREICEAAGVTKPVLYYHYRNKEGVFRAMMNMAVDAHRAVLTEVRAAEGSAADRILMLCERVMALVLEHPDIVRVIDSVYYGPREGSPALDFESLYGEFDGFLGELVQEGVRRGEFRGDDVEATHLALLGAFLICKASLHINPATAHGCRERPMGLNDLRRVINTVLDGVRAARAGGKEELR